MSVRLGQDQMWLVSKYVLYLKHRKKNDIFNNFGQNMDCGYTLEPPPQGSSKEYPQSIIIPPAFMPTGI